MFIVNNYNNHNYRGILIRYKLTRDNINLVRIFLSKLIVLLFTFILSIVL